MLAVVPEDQARLHVLSAQIVAVEAISQAREGEHRHPRLLEKELDADEIRARHLLTPIDRKAMTPDEVGGTLSL